MATRFAGAFLVDLTGLRYKSLLRIAEAGYYEFHPLIRSFALATLEPATQALTEAKLATLYLQFAAEQESAFYGATPQNALCAIEGELDNLQQAWCWAETHARLELLLPSVAALGEYYAASGRSVEGEALFLPLARQLFAQAAHTANGLFSLHLLRQLCRMLMMQTKLPEAMDWSQKLVALAQKTGNQEFEARCLCFWGCALSEAGQIEAARRKTQDALTLARQLNQPRLLGMSCLTWACCF